MNTDNLKLVRVAIAAQEHKEINLGSIMNNVHNCGTPSCIIGHAYFVSEALAGHEVGKFIQNEEDWQHIQDRARIFLDLTVDQSEALFTPDIRSADFDAIEGDQGFITKDHVLRTLDLIIDGETDIIDAWSQGRIND